MAGGGGQGQGYTSNSGGGQMYGGVLGGGNAYAQQVSPPTIGLNGTPFMGQQPAQTTPFGGAVNTAIAPAQPNPQTQGGGISGLLSGGYNNGVMGDMSGHGMGGEQDVVVHGHALGGGQSSMQQPVNPFAQQQLTGQMATPFQPLNNTQNAYAQQLGFMGSLPND